MIKKTETKANNFEFTGDLVSAGIFGLDYKDNFSPSISLDGAEQRMDERIKKVRKMKKNNIFTGQFHAYKQNQE